MFQQAIQTQQQYQEQQPASVLVLTLQEGDSTKEAMKGKYIFHFFISCFILMLNFNYS